MCQTFRHVRVVAPPPANHLPQAILFENGAKRLQIELPRLKIVFEIPYGIVRKSV